MADVNPPSGGNPQNPFFSGQQKQDISVNTGPAMIAFQHLEQVLTDLSKNFGKAFSVTTGENLKAQENFYKYIGDKESERRVTVERLKRAAIDSIKEETKAKIAAFEEEAKAGIKSKEDVAKRALELSMQEKTQIAKVTEEAAKRAQGPGVVGRTFQGVQNVAGRIGGPIGGVVSGVANLITEPEVAIPALILGSLLEIANKRAAFTKTGINLAAAGLGATGGTAAAAQITGSDFALKMFSGLQGSLSQSEQRAMIAGAASSRTLISQASTDRGMERLRGNLGLFANILPDASKEMELFTDATKSLGMTGQDVSKTFFQSSKAARDLKVNQLDAIGAQMDMQKALRNITNDGTVAASVLDNVGTFFKDIGKSEAERIRMTVGVANAGANLGLPQIAGMLAFTRGLSPTSDAMRSAIFGEGPNGKGGMLGKEGGGVFGLMGDFFTKVGNQTKNPMERMFIADQLNKQFGLGIQTQDLPQFFKMAETLRAGGSREKFAADVAALSKASKQMTVEGMDKLTSIVDPITKIKDFFDAFWTGLDARLGNIPFYKSGSGKAAIHPNSQSLPQHNVANGKPKAMSSQFDVHVSGQ
ncbi:MAG: hypothetical protein ACREBR_05620 [bacterium]